MDNLKMFGEVTEYIDGVMVSKRRNMLTRLPRYFRFHVSGGSDNAFMDPNRLFSEDNIRMNDGELSNCGIAVIDGNYSDPAAFTMITTLANETGGSTESLTYHGEITSSVDRSIEALTLTPNFITNLGDHFQFDMARITKSTPLSILQNQLYEVDWTLDFGASSF